ncbi:MAG: hypothetical protein BYD32DRAFT_286091 [Podila humilis]|nr:MAG: hypothetical protein BYD32DRAFT_286091 [Podila humilis]
MGAKGEGSVHGQMARSSMFRQSCLFLSFALGRRKGQEHEGRGNECWLKIQQKIAFRVLAAKKGEQNEALSRHDIFEYAMTAAVSLRTPWRSRDTKAIEWNINRAQRDRAVNQEAKLLSLLRVLLYVSTITTYSIVMIVNFGLWDLIPFFFLLQQRLKRTLQGDTKRTMLSKAEAKYRSTPPTQGIKPCSAPPHFSFLFVFKPIKPRQSFQSSHLPPSTYHSTLSHTHTPSLSQDTHYYTMTTHADTIDLATARPSVQFPESTHPFDDAKKPVMAETDAFPGHLEMPLTKTNSSAKSNSRRNSLAAFAERLRSRSNSRSRSQRHSLDASTGSNRDSFDESLESDPARKLSDSQFDYAAIIKAQHEFMERLRAEQLQKNIRTNVDGIPIPAMINRRRSSLTQILGMDKPLLAR